MGAGRARRDDWFNATSCPEVRKIAGRQRTTLALRIYPSNGDHVRRSSARKVPGPRLNTRHQRQVPRLPVLDSQGADRAAARAPTGHPTHEGARARTDSAQCRTKSRADVQTARNVSVGVEAYFRLADTTRAFPDIDGRVRQHWNRGRVIYRELVARGMAPDAARRVAANSRRW